MKCPKCDAEIGKNRICPYCEYHLKEKDLTKKEVSEIEEDKSKFIYFFRIAIIIISIISSILLIANEFFIETIIIIIVSSITCVNLKVSEINIDLLQSINKKMEN